MTTDNDLKERVRDAEQTVGNIRVDQAKLEARLQNIESAIVEIRKTQLEIAAHFGNCPYKEPKEKSVLESLNSLPKWLTAIIVTISIGIGSGVTTAIKHLENPVEVGK